MTALLVSDQEREYTVGLLREHLLAGRLTVDEFEARVDEAWRARYAEDLWGALRELPVEAPPVPPARPRRSRTGHTSLALGIASVGLLVLSLGLFFIVTLALGITAWSLGREARRSGVDRGRGAARAGEALGICGTMLSLLFFAGCASVFLL